MSLEMLRNRVSTGCAYTTDFLLFAGASAEQRAAELQKQLDNQTAKILLMEEQQSILQAAAVAAAHGMQQPFVCCSTSSMAFASHICLFLWLFKVCLSLDCVPVSLQCRLSAPPQFCGGSSC
jgi:arginine/ornithine N-succinyltransferase beta subunit